MHREYTRDPNVSCCSRHSDFPEPKGHVMPWSIDWRHSNPYCSAQSHNCTLRIAAQVAISVVYQHLNLGAVQKFRNVWDQLWVDPASNRAGDARGVAPDVSESKV
jgi:hypothetical protein